MRTEDEGLRGRILAHYLTFQREILLPDTTTIPLATPKVYTTPLFILAFCAPFSPIDVVLL